jgi:hypothetical protein
MPWRFGGRRRHQRQQSVVHTLWVNGIEDAAQIKDDSVRLPEHDIS